MIPVNLAKKRLVYFFVAFLIAIPGLLQVTQHADPTMAVLPDKGRIAEAYADYLDNYPADFGALIVVQSPGCNAESWQVLTRLHDDIANMPEVDRVFSPVSAEFVYGYNETVEVNRLRDVESIPQRCRILKSYAPFQQLLVAAEHNAFSLHVTARPTMTAEKFSLAIEEVLAPHLGSEHKIYLSGELIMSHDLMELSLKDSVVMVYAVIAMFFLIWLFTRSVTTGLIAILSGSLSMVFTLALMGYTDIALSPINNLIIYMLIPLGAAFTIHATAYDPDQNTSAMSAAVPFGFATFTTVLGFGLTAFNTSPEVRMLGFLGMFGIIANFCIVFLLTFPLMRLAGVRRTEHFLHPGVRTIANSPFFRKLVKPSSRTLGIVLLSLACFTGIGLSSVKVDYSPIDYLKPDNPSRVSFDTIGQWFGTYAIPAVVQTGEPGSALDPASWQAVDSLVDQLESKYTGLHTAWLHDQLSVVNTAFTNQEPDNNTFVQSRQLMAQYLLLFNPDDLSHYINFDQSSFVLLFQTPFKTASEFLQFKQDILDFAAENQINIEMTGRINGFFEIGQRIAWDNLISLLAGAVILLVVFSLYLHSTAAGLVVLLINALPVLFCFSVLGWLKIPLDLGSSVVAAIALGLVLDDSSHLLARYRYYRTMSYDSHTSADFMVQDLWRPVVTTTLTIVIGLSMMNFADIVLFHTFSLVLCSALAVACVADLIVLPALLPLVDKSKALVSGPYLTPEIPARGTPTDVKAEVTEKLESS